MTFGSIKNVRKIFSPSDTGRAGGEPVVALDDASFEFTRGELISFLGPSGCGKTTLLRIIAGLIPKTSGSVAIDGREVNEPLGNYGFVFQAPSLMHWRSVLDNVLFPMEILRKNDATARKRATDLLDLVGLSAFMSARPHQLSGGMQQRVALCRALIHQPALLLMDEPFGALDEFTRLEMNDLLLRIRKETNATVLFVTHSISEAIYLSDKVLVFSRRPARVVKEIAVDLPYPRLQQARFQATFTALERLASEALGVIPAASASEVN
ncbi:ABC transporter ATP-binding protein [Bradyrhizobium sp. CCGUVB1N3]|uniref:ABC transporter ATP-binding protein n=1 Tax=Bradyrhizobium sp. CCGUVB1N3 TaxID=2949629 RepID=UPI0020B39842|nr:ABC transporter ATP-binding protein [Bradyrhizobium sp. CCGUVB1N3]MCP3469047.1 ABC transporter ATP-binding protein [Bradyrhizobium sp. CCGUVB1N3]